MIESLNFHIARGKRETRRQKTHPRRIVEEGPRRNARNQRKMKSSHFQTARSKARDQVAKNATKANPRAGKRASGSVEGIQEAQKIIKSSHFQMARSQGRDQEPKKATEGNRREAKRTTLEAYKEGIQKVQKQSEGHFQNCSVESARQATKPKRNARSPKSNQKLALSNWSVESEKTRRPKRRPRRSLERQNQPH